METFAQYLPDSSIGFQWTATLTGIFAALAVSLNLGNRITGFAFIVFTVSSLCWSAVALIQEELPLLIQNGVLTVINVIGVYRWLYLKPAQEEEAEEEQEEAADAGQTAQPA